METEKSTRLLYLYQDLTKGVGIQKKAAADRFGVKLVGLLCWPIKQAKQQNLPGSVRNRGDFIISIYHLPGESYFLGFLMAAWAAARRAMGTRKGEQET